ncbi:DUF5333 domain-containing protein [Loktanella sp. SALINAS62]|uniref:DUF5333 domain-containing protein n=1 Tax=Loktanella sp. SALINAS62 TaxID=2706124 RepID=UPI001B8CF591|nr:DUF5333 domain-containing protein [Loktanella sp. SALINAS62]MBS1304206.1 DUF5333 domain-containing protein [Loktanella sp. SALINAS62]
MRTLIAAAVLATGLTGPATAQGLAEEPEINNALIVVGMAYEISRQCDDIDARTFQGIRTLFNLKSRARDLGYSGAEVDAYIDDDVQKDRLKTIARRQLRQLGAVDGDPASFCTVGRAQIAKATGIGRLLR